LTESIAIKRVYLCVYYCNLSYVASINKKVEAIAEKDLIM